MCSRIGIFLCTVKVKCTDEVVDNLDFPHLDSGARFLHRADFRHQNFFHKLIEDGDIQLGDVCVLSHSSHKVFDVDRLFLLLLYVLPQPFNGRVEVLLKLIVMG